MHEKYETCLPTYAKNYSMPFEQLKILLYEDTKAINVSTVFLFQYIFQIFLAFRVFLMLVNYQDTLLDGKVVKVHFA